MPYMAVTEPDWTGNTSNLADDPYYWLWMLKRVVLARQQWLDFPANDGSKDPAKQISLAHKHSMAEMVAYCVKLYEYKLAETLAPSSASYDITDFARYVPPGYPYQAVMGWQKRLACHLLWQDGGIWVLPFSLAVIECRQRTCEGWGDTIAEAVAAARENRLSAEWVAVDPPTAAKYRKCAYLEVMPPGHGEHPFGVLGIETVPVAEPSFEWPTGPLAYTIELPQYLIEPPPVDYPRQFQYTGGPYALTAEGNYLWGRVPVGSAEFPGDCPFEFAPGEEQPCAWGWEAHQADFLLVRAWDNPSWDSRFREAHDIPFYSAPPETPAPVPPPAPSPALPSRPVPRPGDRPMTRPGWRNDMDVDGMNAPL